MANSEDRARPAGAMALMAHDLEQYFCPVAFTARVFWQFSHTMV